MLSTYEAKRLIQERIQPLPSKEIHISQAIGYTLADHQYAKVDVPFYAQSSMDGYAFRFEDWQEGSPLKIAGKMKAGHKERIHVDRGQAVRIFTGAPVPEGLNTVVMQEKTTVEGDNLYINDINLTFGSNVRHRASEIKQGDIGLSQGTILNAAAIGFLASVGISHVQVVRKPKISVIVTGDELQTIGKPLSYGQVYESNSHTVKAALNHLLLNELTFYMVPDSLSALSITLDKALVTSDLVLLTGGISAGEYDFVSKACEDCGVIRIFHKLKQKPGKPIYFGMKNEKAVFGLPGNPASVLTCLYQYVTLALDRLSGTQIYPKQQMTPSLSSYKKPLGITHFLKAYFDGKTVSIREGQESYKLNSFALSNCLIEIPEDVEIINEGDLVKIYLL
ncbi:MAG: hypothetical protein RLZZ546_715 [Bacteroidota bacterium]|jgi:molybdopterin molybdotransferase